MSRAGSAAAWRAWEVLESREGEATFHALKALDAWICCNKPGQLGAALATKAANSEAKTLATRAANFAFLASGHGLIGDEPSNRTSWMLSACEFAGKATDKPRAVCTLVAAAEAICHRSLMLDSIREALTAWVLRVSVDS